MKIRILQEFNGRVDGKSIHFMPGWVGEIPDDDADHMVRGHYAEIFKPAVKIVNKPEMGKAVKIIRDK